MNVFWANYELIPKPKLIIKGILGGWDPDPKSHFRVTTGW